MRAKNRPNNKKDIESEIKNLLNVLIQSQEDSDWDTFESCFHKSDDVIHLGTDIDEIWIGWMDFEKWMKKVFKEKKRLQIFERSIAIRIDDNLQTAWYSQLIDTCIETKGDTTRIEGFRHTGVLQLIDKKWQIVQSHISAPVFETTNNASDHLLMTYHN